MSASNNKYQYLSFTVFKKLPLLHLFIAKSTKSDNFPVVSHSEIVSEVLANLGYPRRPVISLKQIHSNCAITLKAGPDFDTAHFQPEADAVFTNRRDVYLTVRIADCLPIYVLDYANQVIGLIHAGWRGALLEIAKKSLQSAQKELGLNPQTSTVLFGPYIKSCCYEVSAEVGVFFQKSSTFNRVGKVFLDLGHENKQQFIEAGINPKQIHISNQCTCCNPDLFFSYRRSKNKYMRMYAVLGLK